MSDDPQDVPLELVIETAFLSLLSGVNTSQPGILTDYDPATQRASVRPLVQRAHVQETGAEKVEIVAEVHDVIVLHPGAARGRITFPVKKGDTCLLFHTSVAISKWRLRGGSVDPGDDRMHDLSDGIALVGLHSFNEVPTPAPDDAVVVHVSGGVKVKLGGPSASDGVVRLSDLEALVTGLDIKIAALTAGLPATATELASVQAFRDAIPAGWPSASTTTFSE